MLSWLPYSLVTIRRIFVHILKEQKANKSSCFLDLSEHPRYIVNAHLKMKSWHRECVLTPRILNGKDVKRKISISS